MHLTRAEVSRVTPVARKGTKYVARPLAFTDDSVSVLTAVRDMLSLARTSREVNEMIKDKKLKVNGRIVKDSREPLTLLSVLEADKMYLTTLLPTGRFVLEPIKSKTRIAKVIGKKILRNNVVQVNLHDGTNIITKEKLAIGDSVQLSIDAKFEKVLPLKQGAKVLIRSGRNVGMKGTVTKLEEQMLVLDVEGREVSIERQQVIVL